MPLTQTQRTIFEEIQSRYLTAGGTDPSLLAGVMPELYQLSQILSEGGVSSESATPITITPTVQVIDNSAGSNPLTGSIATGKWFIYYETKQGSSTFHGQTYGEGFFDSENFKFLGKDYVYGAINYSVPAGSILVVRYYPA